MTTTEKKKHHFQNGCLEAKAYGDFIDTRKQKPPKSTNLFTPRATRANMDTAMPAGAGYAPYAANICKTVNAITAYSKVESDCSFSDVMP
jgi:hypothetical protein